MSNLPKDMLSRSSMLLVQGLKACIDIPGALRHEIMTSPDFWSLMRIMASRHDAAPVAFELLERACIGVPPAVMADNYEAAILLLGEFATAAGRLVLAERKREQLRQHSRDGERKAAAKYATSNLS